VTIDTTGSDFPTSIGDWTGRKQRLDPIFQEALALDDYLMADYTEGANQSVSLYIAWYDSQRAGRSAHSPRSCLPGGGWQIESITQVPIPGIVVEGQPLTVNRVLIQLGSSRQLVYYWFQQRGRIITNEYTTKWYLFWDSLTRNRTDGALVRLSIAVPHSQTVGAAEHELSEFLHQAAPRLEPYVPR